MPVAPLVLPLRRFPALAWRRRALAALQQSDPGLLRTFIALRVVTCVVLTGGLLLPGLKLTGLPLTVAAPALVLAMVLPVLVRQTGWRDYARALGLVVACALSTYLCGALLAPWPALVQAGFILVLTLAVAVHPLGLGPTAAGMVAGVLYYVGLYLHPGPADLGAALAIVPVALAVVVLVCRVLLPSAPAAVLRRAVQALACRGAAVLRRMAEGREPDLALARLNEVALLVEDHLALAAGRVGAGAAYAASMAEAVLAFEQAVGALRLRPPPRECARLLLACAARLEEGAFAPPRGVDVPCGPTRRTVRDIEVAAARMSEIAGAAATGFRPAPGAPAAGPVALAWRAAVRVALAGTLTLWVGLAISPERWFWGVFSVFLVLLGMRSRAEMIHRSAQRIIGTLAGVVAGAAATYALRGHPAAEVALMLVCVAGWAFFILHAYAKAIFFLTVLVGLVYGSLGATMSELLEIRLAEVSAGCLIAMLCALVIFPVPTRPLLARQVRAVMAGLAEVVRLSRQRLAGDVSAQPVRAMRAVDRSFREAAGALASLEAARRLVVGAEPDPLPRTLLASVHWARQVAGQAESGSLVLTADGAARLARAEASLTAPADGETATADLAAANEALEAALRAPGPYENGAPGSGAPLSS